MGALISFIIVAFCALMLVLFIHEILNPKGTIKEILPQKQNPDFCEFNEGINKTNKLNKMTMKENDEMPKNARIILVKDRKDVKPLFVLGWVALNVDSLTGQRKGFIFRLDFNPGKWSENAFLIPIERFLELLAKIDGQIESKEEIDFNKVHDLHHLHSLCCIFLYREVTECIKIYSEQEKPIFENIDSEVLILSPGCSLDYVEKWVNEKPIEHGAPKVKREEIEQIIDREKFAEREEKERRMNREEKRATLRAQAIDAFKDADQFNRHFALNAVRYELSIAEKSAEDSRILLQQMEEIMNENKG